VPLYEIRNASGVINYSSLANNTKAGVVGACFRCVFFARAQMSRVKNFPGKWPEMSWKCPGNVLEFHSLKSVGTLSRCFTVAGVENRTQVPRVVLLHQNAPSISPSADQFFNGIITKQPCPKTAVSQTGRALTNQGIFWYGMVLFIGLRMAVFGHGRFWNGLSGT